MRVKAPHRPASLGLRALTVMALCFVSTGGQASLYDTYGAGARGTALGGSMVALSTTLEAVYYNPANILAREVNHIGIGVTGLVPQLAISRLDDPEAPLPHLLPTRNMGFQLGLSVPLGGVFKNKVGFGVTLFHPLLEVTRVESIDPSTPYFYRYQSLPNKLILGGVVAFKPTRWLRFGAGVQVLAELGGRVTADISLAERRVLSRSVDLDVRAVTAATAGMTLGPFEGVSFGVTWRSALELGYQIPMTVNVEEIGTLKFLADGVSLYTPGQLAAGLAWESHPGVDQGWSIECGLTWERWSVAPPSGALFHLSLDDANLSEAEPETLVSSIREPIALEGRDTLTPRVGMQYRPNADWALRGGYFFRPTPLPLPAYENNTVDASAHVFSLGAGYVFVDPTKIHRAPLQVDIVIQATVLNNRTVTKAAGYAPEGTYRASGIIWHTGIDLRHNY